MTDRSKWTDEQINEAIAKAKGWVYYKPTKTWGRRETADQIHGSLPDYTHDWRFAGELLEEMAEAGLEASLCFDDTIGWFLKAKFGKPPQRAICEAWLAWKDKEVNDGLV